MDAFHMTNFAFGPKYKHSRSTACAVTVLCSSIELIEAGMKDSADLSKVQAQGVEEAVQHEQEEEEDEDSQVVHWHHTLICNVQDRSSTC